MTPMDVAGINWLDPEKGKPDNPSVGDAIAVSGELDPEVWNGERWMLWKEWWFAVGRDLNPYRFLPPAEDHPEGADPGDLYWNTRVDEPYEFNGVYWSRIKIIETPEERARAELAEILRAESDGGITEHPMMCCRCGYAGRFNTIGCACYDEWAASCTPTSRGPGCFNGAPVCPVCEGSEIDTGDGRVTRALMVAEGCELEDVDRWLRDFEELYVEAMKRSKKHPAASPRTALEDEVLALMKGDE